MAIFHRVLLPPDTPKTALSVPLHPGESSSLTEPLPTSEILSSDLVFLIQIDFAGL